MYGLYSFSSNRLDTHLKFCTEINDWCASILMPISLACMLWSFAANSDNVNDTFCKCNEEMKC